MTVVVGIYCKDGVVIAADSALTLNSLIEQEYPKKIAVINESGLLTGFAGDLGFAQRYRQVAQDLWEEAPNIDTHTLINAFSAKGVQEFYKTHTSNLNLEIPTSFLVGFVHEGKHHLITLPSGTFQPTVLNERLWYCSLGSGAIITTPFTGFLRQVFWNDGPPSLQDGIFAAFMCLQLAIDINSGGVSDPIHIGVIEKQEDGYIARKLSPDEISEHKENHKAAIQYFARYPEEFKKKRENAEPIPKPQEETAA